MDKILKAAEQIVDIFQYLNREEVELNCEKSQVIKILKDVVAQNSTSTNKQSVPCHYCDGGLPAKSRIANQTFCPYCGKKHGTHL